MWQPPAIIASFGSITIHTYGMLLAGAIGLGWLWAERRTRSRKLPSELVGTVLFWAIVGGLVGARLGFVLQELGYFASHWQEILAVWQGGLSFHGGLVGGLIGGYLSLRRQQALQYFWQLADSASAPLLVAAAIGRLGNWANQELYGYPTGLPWAIPIDLAHRLPGYEAFATFHPTFLYEALFNLVGVVILIFLFEKHRPHTSYSLSLTPGISFLFALGWYGLARGITEIWRIGDRILGPLSLAQVVSLGMILASLWLISWLRSHK